MGIHVYMCVYTVEQNTAHKKAHTNKITITVITISETELLSHEFSSLRW